MSHFHDQIDELRQKLLRMSFLVEETVSRACDALFSANARLAKDVIEHDEAINRFELEIDEAGHSLFATGQPVAADLRMVMMMLKINTSLERIGDHAVNIAQKTLLVLQEPPLAGDFQLESLARKTSRTLRAALNSFLKQDVEMAQDVLKQDDAIDQINRDLFPKLKAVLLTDPKAAGAAMAYLLIGHNLERIADLAGNIAEDVIYLKQGREVRHRVELEPHS